MAYLLYRIYYDGTLVYIGQTAQAIDRRLQKHFFAPAHIRKIDPRLVTSVEVASCASRADMNVYERYYIELHKPELNFLEKDIDDLSPSVRLPDLDFQEAHIPLMDKWRVKIAEVEQGEQAAKEEKIRRFTESQALRRQRRAGEISEDEYYTRLEAMQGDSF